MSFKIKLDFRLENFAGDGFLLEIFVTKKCVEFLNFNIFSNV
jgi:hypothetical protein